jgi:hypothetical protein
MSAEGMMGPGLDTAWSRPSFLQILLSAERSAEDAPAPGLQLNRPKPYQVFAPEPAEDLQSLKWRARGLTDALS